MHESDRRGHKPSLSIADGDDGRVLLHCHAGCECRTICEQLGVEMRDLFPVSTSAPTQPTGKSKRRPKIYPTPEAAIAAAARSTKGKQVSQWVYHNSDGAEAFRIIRFAVGEG